MTEPRYLRRVDGGTSPTTPSTSSRPTPTTATPSASPTTTAQTKQIHYPASWSSLVSALKRGPPSPAFTRRTDEESDESSPGFFRLRHVNVDGTIPTSASRGSRMTRPRLPGSMLGQDTPTAGSDGSTEPRFPRRPILARSRSQLPEGSSRLSYPPLPSYRSQIGPDNVNIVVVENDLSMVDQKGDITPTACPNSTPSTSATATPPKSCTRAGPLEYNHRASVWPCVPPEWKQRIWPALKRLHNQSFDDPDKELAYQREAWGSLKYGALLASVFFLITWVSWCSFMWGHIMLYWVSEIRVVLSGFR
jgi:hypothetical protein